MFVWSVASLKDVVGEIARRLFDTTTTQPFCLVNNRAWHVILKTRVCLRAAAAGLKLIIEFIRRLTARWSQVLIWLGALLCS